MRHRPPPGGVVLFGDLLAPAGLAPRAARDLV